MSNKLAPYYPCHGAMLQISIFPTQNPVITTPIALEMYPVIIDFEPKKREIYFSTTENEEILSTSRSSLGVNKSRTTASSLETRLDMNTSVNIAGDGVNAGFSGGFSQKMGSSAQNTNTIAMDYSREKRESFSYTTNLTHMYHLLDSYHLGTNGAVFFVQPRPYISDKEQFSFVGGPRKLEDIQEFFLIMERSPAHGFCIEATLETAHLETKRIYKAELILHSKLEIGDNKERTKNVLVLSDEEIGEEGKALEKIAAD